MVKQRWFCSYIDQTQFIQNLTQVPFKGFTATSQGKTMSVSCHLAAEKVKTTMLGFTAGLMHYVVTPEKNNGTIRFCMITAMLGLNMALSKKTDVWLRCYHNWVA